MVAHETNFEFETLHAAFRMQPGYVTPKVDVRGAVFRDEQLLFIREAMDGKWALPGGWADVGETPRDATEREVFEEAGLAVHATRLVGVYDANRVEGELPLYHAYKLVFLCEVAGGNLKVSPETLEARFFPRSALPEMYSDYRTTPRHIDDAWGALQDPTWHTVFD